MRGFRTFVDNAILKKKKQQDAKSLFFFLQLPPYGPVKCFSFSHFIPFRLKKKKNTKLTIKNIYK